MVVNTPSSTVGTVCVQGSHYIVGNGSGSVVGFYVGVPVVVGFSSIDFGQFEHTGHFSKVACDVG